MNSALPGNYVVNGGKLFIGCNNLVNMIYLTNNLEEGRAG